MVTGRSDATLNRGGVRLGTSEFYSVIDELEEVSDSLVVHLDHDDGSDAGQLVLFVALPSGQTLSEDTRQTIAETLRRQLSPRHVPDVIVQVAKIPRTLSAKRMEVPIKRVLLDPDAPVAIEGNASVLQEFRRIGRALRAKSEQVEEPVNSSVDSARFA